MKTISSPRPFLNVTNQVSQPYFLSVVQQLKSCLGRLIVEISTSHTIRHKHQVGLLWTSDRLVSETAKYTAKQTQQTNIHALGWIRTHNLRNQAATDLRLRPHGHRFRSCKRDRERERERTALFGVISQRVVVISYRRFGTTCPSQRARFSSASWRKPATMQEYRCKNVKWLPFHEAAVWISGLLQY